MGNLNGDHIVILGTGQLRSNCPCSLRLDRILESQQSLMERILLGVRLIIILC